MSNFNADYLRGREGENIVADVLTRICDNHIVYPVTDLHEQHNGDLKLIDRKTNDITYVEVKRDDYIHKTGNIYLEEWQYKGAYDVPGFMYSAYEYIIFLCEQMSLMYVVDFSILKKNYKKSFYHGLPRNEYDREYYLTDEYQLRKWGALMCVVDYGDINNIRVVKKI